jgi:hypothetical protein
MTAMELRMPDIVKQAVSRFPASLGLTGALEGFWGERLVRFPYLPFESITVVAKTFV